MSFSHRLALVGLIFVLAGCQSAPEARSVERLALLPFDNLTGDRSLDWLGAGAQIVLNRQLLSSRLISASVYPSAADAVLGRATRLLHGTVEKQAGKFRLEAYIEDGASHKQVERFAVTGSADQLLPALDQMAHRLATDASAPPAQQLLAVASYVEARTLPTPDARAAALVRATQLDPTFGLPAISLAELNLTAGRPAEAQAALEAAGKRQLDKVEQEQVAFLKANLTQDKAAQAQALVKLAAASPMQPNLQIFSASTLERLHQLPQALSAFDQAVKIDPENAAAWNRVGYGNAYAGRLPEARKALETYQRLEPNEPNPLDSLGEVHYMRADFKSAAEYFKAAYAKAPQFDAGRGLLKAAYAYLLDGQYPQSDQAWDQYAKATANNPTLPIAQAHYLYASGHPKAAIDGLQEAAAKAAPALRGLFNAHRCGLLLPVDRAAAAAAARDTPTPAAALCGFLSQPSASPAEWTHRAERVQNERGRRELLAYALFFDRHYTEAFPLLDALVLENSLDTDSELRVLLTECQWRTERWPSARESVARWPLPATDSIFAGWHVPSFVTSTLKAGEHYDDNNVSRRWSPIGKKVLVAYEP